MGSVIDYVIERHQLHHPFRLKRPTKMQQNISAVGGQKRGGEVFNAMCQLYEMLRAWVWGFTSCPYNFKFNSLLPTHRAL